MTAPIRNNDPQIIQLIEENNNKNRIRVDSEFPNVVLTRYNRFNQRENFRTHDELKNRRVVVFTVPGAWTPVCTNKHLPGFKNDANTVLGLNIDNIVCIAPDKVDVVRAWNQVHGDPTKIDMWADNENELTVKMGLGYDMSGGRAQGLGMMRTAFVVNNLKVEWIGIDEDAANCVLSHADNVINYLKTRRQ